MLGLVWLTGFDFNDSPRNEVEARARETMLGRFEGVHAYEDITLLPEPRGLNAELERIMRLNGNTSPEPSSEN